jgi:hypothetical protein
MNVTEYAKTLHAQFSKYASTKPTLFIDLTSKLKCENIEEWLLTTDEIAHLIQQGTFKNPDTELADKMYLFQIAKLGEMLGLEKEDATRMALSAYATALQNGWFK